MSKVVFINCQELPFIDWIIARKKTRETRTRNTLGRLIGERVYLAETGKGKPLVRCVATIESVAVARTRSEWRK